MARRVEAPAPKIEPNFPNPVQFARASVEAPSGPRSLYCGYYGQCLEYAAKKGWTDWTCQRCELFGRDKVPSATEWATRRFSE